MSTGKALICERVIQTLKMYITRYCTHFATKTFLPVLHDIVDAYNNRFHRSIGMSPNECERSLFNQGKVRTKNEQRYKAIKEKVTKQPPRFELGQLVRVFKPKSSFGRKYDLKTFNEVFVVNRLDKNKPVVAYELKSLIENDVIDGMYLESEITEVRFNKDIYIAEGGKILRETPDRKKFLVRLNFAGTLEAPPTPVWILSSDLI